MKLRLRYIILPMDVWLLQHHLLERLCFPHWVAFAILKTVWENNFSKIIWAYFCGFVCYFLYWVPYTVPLISVSVLPTIPHSLDYCGYKISLETGCTGSSPFFFLFKIVLATLVPLFSTFTLESACLYL